MSVNVRSLIQICLAVVLLSLLALMLPASLVEAQDNGEITGFKDVILSIYPEYDDPYQIGYPLVLVMLEGEIESAEPPVTVSFLVPEEAIMYSAGSGPRETYIGGPPDRKPSDIDGWDEISYTLFTPYFVVEYYFPIQTTSEKAFSASLIPLYPVTNLTVYVQEPRKANNFSSTAGILPENQGYFKDIDGFNIRQYDYQSIQGNESLDFYVQYTRKVSAPSMGLQASSTKLWLILGVIIGVCVLLVIVWIFRGHIMAKGKPVKGKPLKGRSAKGKPDDQDIIQEFGDEERSTARYCTQCGNKIARSSRFCANCGAQIRK